MENYTLHFIITPYGRFVGKFSISNNDVDEFHMILTDVVEFYNVHTDQGMAMVGVIIGMAKFITNKVIICVLDTKSPYYTQYYQASSGLTVSGLTTPTKRH